MNRVGEERTDHVRLCTRFRFAKDGVSKNAEFSGPVVLVREGLFLVARRATTPSDRVAIAVLGLVGQLVSMMTNSVNRVELPYPAVPAGELPEGLSRARGFGRLRPKDRVVVLRRSQIRGYRSSLLTGFTLFCHGESIRLSGPLGRMKKAFARFGFVECRE